MDVKKQGEKEDPYHVLWSENKSQRSLYQYHWKCFEVFKICAGRFFIKGGGDPSTLIVAHPEKSARQVVIWESGSRFFMAV